MTSKHTNTRGAFDLTPGGWVRLALYVVLVLAAVVAGVGSEFGLGQFEGVAAQLLVVLGAVTGTTASMNVSKAPDHEMKLSEVVPALRNLSHEVRDMHLTTPDIIAERVSERTAEKLRPKPVDDGGDTAALPVFRRP